MTEARRHHYVPVFLLAPWVLHGELNGYWWNERKDALDYKKKGPKAFCNVMDLLSLRTHKNGRDALEAGFFQKIDEQGAAVRDYFLQNNVADLNVDQRIEFARLLFSLDMRREQIVERLRSDKQKYADGLNRDERIKAWMAHNGYEGDPASLAEQVLGSLEDRALLVIQKLVDNRDIGARLINAQWHVARVQPLDGTFVLSDRPLIRLNAFDHPNGAWILPLTPSVIFVAMNSPDDLVRLKRMTGQRLVKTINSLSANQSDRFIFSVEPGHARWIAPRLKEKDKARRATVTKHHETETQSAADSN